MSTLAGRQPTDRWPRDALPSGTQLHGYTIVGVLGRGGFGITYRAVDRLDQIFAIKECYPKQFAVRHHETEVFPCEDEDAEILTDCLNRFTREARALTLFSSSGAAGGGVVKVLTSFEANRTAYIVMEFIDGESLEALIDRHPEGMPEAAVSKILDHMLTALLEVHRNNLLHRDIKPGNILLRRDGRPVLLDFGAVRVLQPGISHRSAQIYTEAYAPLEQIAGRKEGPFSDLYSLGATCYNMIAGAAFRGAPSSTNRAAAMHKGPDPLVPAVTLGAGRYDPSLLRGIDLLLKVDPEHRPESVEAFLKEWRGDDRAASSQIPLSDVDTQYEPATGANGPRGPVPQPSTDSETTEYAPSGAGIAPAFPGQREPALTVRARPGFGRADPGRPAAGTHPDGGTTPRGKGMVMALAAAALAGVALVAGGGIYWFHGSGKGGGDVAVTGASYAPSSPAPVAQSPVEGAVAPAPALASNQDSAPASGSAPLPASGGAGASAPAGAPLSSFDEGDRAYRRGDYAAALPYYQTAVAAKDARAQYQLGYMYQFGQGVPRDYEAAYRLYNQAAMQNLKTAEYQLGWLTQNGLGTQRDPAAALQWYKKAAEQQLASAQYQIGYFYQTGLAVQKNEAEALKWYMAAAEQGLASAMYSVGHFYAEGIAVARDIEAARKWMAKAAAGGNASAVNWLATHR